MKQTSVIVIKEVDGSWTLQIKCNIGTVNEFVKTKNFKKLIYAMEAASILRMHIDNELDLPLNQYYKAC